MTLLDRLEARIIPEPNSGCWLWIGGVDGKGYPIIHIRPQMKKVHRVMYELVKGPIPDGMTLDHLCRTRRCCNTNHLEVVTGAENTRRGTRLRTHCKEGHPFDEKLHSRGHRRCGECERIRNRKAYWAKKTRETQAASALA